MGCGNNPHAVSGEARDRIHMTGSCGLAGGAPPAGKVHEIGIETVDIVRATFLAIPLCGDVAVGTGGV